MLLSQITRPQPRARMSGSTAFMQMNPPRTLMPITWSNSSRETSNSAVLREMPAFDTRMSIGPSCCCASATAPATDAGSVTSISRPIALAPSSAALRRAPAPSTSARSTRAPGRTNTRAISRPIPCSEPAPVMRTTRPSRRNGWRSATESRQKLAGDRLGFAQRVGLAHDHDQLGEPSLTEALNFGQQHIQVVATVAELDGEANLRRITAHLRTVALQHLGLVDHLLD